MNSSHLEPTRTILISGFKTIEELERYKESVFNAESMTEVFSVKQSNLLFILFFDLRESIKFYSFFKKQNNFSNLCISYTISKYELPKKNEDCSEKNKQSTITFEFLGLDVKLDDNFIVNFLKQYGEVKDLKGSSPFLKVIEFYNSNDARKAFNTLNNSPFATGEIQCRWDWDLSSSTRMAYIKLTDEFIKKCMHTNNNENKNYTEHSKRIKVEESHNTSKNMFIELFDRYICDNISEIEFLFT